jgi:hypothetical protein
MSTKKNARKFTRNPAQAALISRCAARAVDLYAQSGETQSRIYIEMDLSAANANGCPMDFEKLLNASDTTFMHDVAGVQSHINRTNGRLTAHFVPRCAMTGS